MPHDDLILVRYKDERVVLSTDELETENSANYRNLFRKLIETKYSSWGYEKEYRLLGSPSDARIQFEEGVRFLKYPASALQRIILGCDCPLPLSDVRGWLDKSQCAHVEIYQAKLSDSRFCIEIP